MIDIQIIQKDSSIVSVELSGHADSGPYGYDIVCAAVSALTIGTANSLMVLAGIPLDVKSANEEGGYLKFSLPKDLTEKQIETARILLDSLCLSLSSTEEEYGEHLKITTLNNK